MWSLLSHILSGLGRVLMIKRLLIAELYIKGFEWLYRKRSVITRMSSTQQKISLQKQKAQTTNRFDSLGCLLQLTSISSKKEIIIISDNPKALSSSTNFQMVLLSS